MHAWWPPRAVALDEAQLRRGIAESVAAALDSRLVRLRRLVPEEVPPDFVCAITQEIMNDPVVAGDGGLRTLAPLPLRLRPLAPTSSPPRSRHASRRPPQYPFVPLLCLAHWTALSSHSSRVLCMAHHIGATRLQKHTNARQSRAGCSRPIARRCMGHPSRRARCFFRISTCGASSRPSAPSSHPFWPMVTHEGACVRDVVAMMKHLILRHDVARAGGEKGRVVVDSIKHERGV